MHAWHACSAEGAECMHRMHARACILPARVWFDTPAAAPRAARRIPWAKPTPPRYGGAKTARTECGFTVVFTAVFTEVFTVFFVWGTILFRGK